MTVGNAGDARLGGEINGEQAGQADRGADDGRVHVMITQPGRGFAEVVLLGLDLGVAMFGAEGAQQGRDEVETRADRVAQSQGCRPGLGGGHARACAARSRSARARSASAAKTAPAGVSSTVRVVRVSRVTPSEVFQLLDGLTEVGRRHMQPFGRRGELRSRATARKASICRKVI